MNIPVTYNNLALQHSPFQNDQSQNFNRERPPEDNSRRDVQAQSGSVAQDRVFRGELLEAVENEKRNQPQFNQNISPQNRQAIETYNAGGTVSPDRDPRGQLLNQFV